MTDFTVVIRRIVRNKTGNGCQSQNYQYEKKALNNCDEAPAQSMKC